jgi:alpha-N-arabinofuranosidase
METERALDASVEATRPAEGRLVRRHLFGKFTEHLGRNVYGGAWAQIVPNPEVAPPSAWPDPDELRRRLEAAERAFELEGLAPAGAAPWWAPDGGLTVARGTHLGRPTVVLGQPPEERTRGAALVTPLHLPTHRSLRYRLQIWLRGPGTLRAALRRPGEGVWAEAALEAPRGWVMVETALEGRAAPPAGSALHLALEPGAAIELRRCFLWPEDHLDGWDPDVVRFMREAHLPLLRFPGGNFASGYHWRDGVGPLDGRPVLPNPAWPEVEWNHVGSGEWLRLCALVGCEPLVCVNAGDGTPEEAADWVEYCNGAPESPMGALRASHGHPEPHGVRLWEVGNELYGSWQVGHTDAAGYAARYRRFAEAMLARDPGIRLIANGDTPAWNRGVAAGGGPEVRTLSHHCLYGGFPADADPRRVYLEHMAFTPAYGRLWTELARPMRDAGLVPRLAITEQQVFTRRPDLPNNATLTEAVWTASILHEAIRAGDLIELVTHSALVNHGGGLRKEREIVYAQPVWWVTHLYAGAPAPLVALDASVTSPTFEAAPYRLEVAPQADYLDAVVLRAEAGGGKFGGAIVLFLVNRHPDRALAVACALPAGTGEDAEIETLAGDSYMAVNSWQRPDAVRPAAERRRWRHGAEPLRLPPCSVTRVILR